MNDNIEKKAFDFCIKNKHRYTEPRKKVLQIIAESPKPLKAYEILKELGKVLNNPKPPTAYRAIEFWHNKNFIHRIESLNAYSICEAGHFHKGSQFMICSTCGDVTESHICKLPQVIKQSTNKVSFKTLSWNIEINGICNKCN
ncbi:MAG: transcriptional repressor [Rickettsiales bacterium]|nr:transcriptional repressor [Rickettsiales bacterium]